MSCRTGGALPVCICVRTYISACVVAKALCAQNRCVQMSLQCTHPVCQSVESSDHCECQVFPVNIMCVHSKLYLCIAICKNSKNKLYSLSPQVVHVHVLLHSSSSSSSSSSSMINSNLVFCWKHIMIQPRLFSLFQNVMIEPKPCTFPQTVMIQPKPYTLPLWFKPNLAFCLKPIMIQPRPALLHYDWTKPCTLLQNIMIHPRPYTSSQTVMIQPRPCIPLQNVMMQPKHCTIPLWFNPNLAFCLKPIMIQPRPCTFALWLNQALHSGAEHYDSARPYTSSQTVMIQPRPCIPSQNVMIQTLHFCTMIEPNLALHFKTLWFSPDPALCLKPLWSDPDLALCSETLWLTQTLQFPSNHYDPTHYDSTHALHIHS